MHLSQGHQGEYAARVFRMLVFRPRYRLMHCRKWAPQPCWETPTPPQRPSMPWQFAANFRTGWGFSSPYSMRRRWPTELERRPGPYRRDTYRARMDTTQGYLSEHVRKNVPGRRKRSMFYPAA